MERELDQKMESIMSKPGVVGAICTNKRGLCLSAKGIGHPDQAGVLCNIADQAKKLDSNNSNNTSGGGGSGSGSGSSTANPVIRLDSDQGYCLVQKKGDFVLGIFKSNNY